MDAWLHDGTPPPPSRYPRIDNGTLTGWREQESGWNAIRGVPYPNVIQQPEVFDYGPDFTDKRVIVNQPPSPINTYPVLVPRIGKDNNEIGMLLPPNVAVPVGTYTGWNLRDKSIGSEGELLRSTGGYIPLEKTKKIRLKNGDPRPALLERYRDFNDYLSQYIEATHKLAQDRYILEEDAEQLIELAKKNKNLFEE